MPVNRFSPNPVQWINLNLSLVPLSPRHLGIFHRRHFENNLPPKASWKQFSTEGILKMISTEGILKTIFHTKHLENDFPHKALSWTQSQSISDWWSVVSLVSSWHIWRLFVFISISAAMVGKALPDGTSLWWGAAPPLLMRPQFPQICRQSMMNKGEIFTKSTFLQHIF